MPEHEERVRIEGTTARRVLRVPRLIADSPAAVAGIFLGFGNLPGPMRRFCQPCLV